MTRKKYERDTYQEDLEEMMASTTESEEEAEPMTLDERLDFFEHYLEYEIDIYWVRRWIGACDLLQYMTEDTVRRNFRDYIYDADEYFMCNRLRSFIRHMCITVEVKETSRRIEHVLCSMLIRRNQFEIVIPRTYNHWTRQINRQITRRC